MLCGSAGRHSSISAFHGLLHSLGKICLYDGAGGILCVNGELEIINILHRRSVLGNPRIRVQKYP